MQQPPGKPGGFSYLRGPEEVLSLLKICPAPAKKPPGPRGRGAFWTSAGLSGAAFFLLFDDKRRQAEEAMHHL